MRDRSPWTATTFLFTVLVLAGCAAVRPNYDVVLSAVERPSEAQERWGEQLLSSVTEEGVEQYVFEDDMIKVLWLVGEKALNITLENKTEHSIKIVWDEAAYVGADGASHRVMHSGVKYTDKNNHQPPSVVVRKGRIFDMLVPVDNVEYVSSLGWYTTPLFPTAARSKAQAEEQAASYVGKTVQALLPLEIQGVVNEYVFLFDVKGFSVP